MGFEFTVNPILYAVLIVLEIYGLHKMVQYLTGLEIDNKRIINTTLIVATIIYLSDIFIFDFHKTGSRSLLVLLILFVAFKITFQHSYIKAGIQLFVLFVMSFAVDLIIQFISLTLWGSDMTTLMQNFTFLYMVNVSGVYMVVLACKLTKFKLVKLNKLSF